MSKNDSLLTIAVLINPARELHHQPRPDDESDGVSGTGKTTESTDDVHVLQTLIIKEQTAAAALLVSVDIRLHSQLNYPSIVIRAVHVFCVGRNRSLA